MSRRRGFTRAEWDRFTRPRKFDLTRVVSVGFWIAIVAVVYWLAFR